MPMIGVDNAVAKLTVEFNRGAQVAYCIFWYRAEIDPDTVNREDVIASFTVDILEPLADLIISQWSIGNVTIDVVNSELAPLTVASGVGAGAITGEDPLPNYVAFPIRLIRTTKETRSGYKRIPGASEQMAEANAWSTTVAAAWAAFAPDLADPFQDTGLNDWSPVIVRTTLLGEPIENPAQYVYNPVSNAIFINRVTSQVSRKPW